MRQIIESLLAEGFDSHRIIYIPFDELPTLRRIKEPVLAIARWFEQAILKKTMNAQARDTGPAFLFLDEVQNLDAWAPQVKSLVDNNTVRLLLTGSSSLRIEAGRDSLAGRITTIDLGPMHLREISALRFRQEVEPYWTDRDNGGLLKPDFWTGARAFADGHRDFRMRAFQAFSERGAYPFAHERPDVPWHELADHLNETIIKRAIQHDLRMGARGQKRDERLLEEVFRLCCRYAGQAPGQSVFVPEIQQALAANIGWQRVSSYMRFLDGTLLIRLIAPHELRLKRRKSPSKIVLSDHSLRASWNQEVIPLDPAGLDQNPHLADLAGHIAESALGYFLASIPNLDVSWFPERTREPEVDFVVTVGTRRIPIEVKYRRRIDNHTDTLGLRAFLEKSVYNAQFGILVTLEDQVTVSDPRIIPISLSSLLWLR
jgi:predicted AAA+ superfamily ATPase